DDVVLSAVIDLDAGSVEADHVARGRGGAADRVGIAAADFDAEDEVAGRGAGSTADGLDAHRASAGGIDADEVTLDQVAGGGRPRAADGVDAVDLVARDDVARPRRQAADGAAAGVADVDAVVLVRLGGGALRVGADEVAGNRAAAALEFDAVEAEAVDRQA